VSVLVQWFGILNYWWDESTLTFGSSTLFTRPAPGKDASATVCFMHELLTIYKCRMDILESSGADDQIVTVCGFIFQIVRSDTFPHNPDDSIVHTENYVHHMKME